MPWFKLIVGLLLALVVFRIGFWMLRGLATPIAEPPPEGEMRKVNMHYRCGVCGAEVRLTLAASETPEPPRHCMEEMEPYELEL